MPLTIPICFDCKHYEGHFNSVYSCEAFKKIPDDILFSEFDHTKKYPNQKNDIIFEEKE